MRTTARWAADPGQRRWRLALRTIRIGGPNSGIEVARMLDALSQSAGVLREQRLPDEVEPEPTVRFGWPAAGERMPTFEGQPGVR
jgi:hypothetical protein